MKKRIILAILFVATTVSAFYLGRTSASVSMDKALENIEYFEVNDNGLDIYTFDGGIYEWR